MMNANLATKIGLACLLSLVAIVISPSRVLAAGKLFLEPSSKYVNKGDEFEIRVTIDSENNKIFGVDAVVNYSDKDLEIKSIVNGGFFSDLNSATGGSKIEIHGLFSNLYETKSGIGTVAVIKMAAKSEAGISELNFACGSNNETQILDENGNNILSCNSLNNSNVFFGQTQPGTTNTPTPTPRSTATPRATTRPSTTPLIVTLSSYPPSPSPSANPTIESGLSTIQGSVPLPIIIGVVILGILLLAIIITLIRNAKRNREMNEFALPSSPTMPPTPEGNRPNPPTPL